MSFGASGGASGSTTQTSTSTTNPFTGVATGLAPTLATALASLGSGSSITQGVNALTAESNVQTQQGIANIKEAEGASGARYGSSVAQNISQFQVQQSTALGAQIAQFQQGAVSNQLAALQEILQAGQGTSATTGKSSTLGWNVASSFGIGQNASVVV
jgi:hypothetical protein